MKHIVHTLISLALVNAPLVALAADGGSTYNNNCINCHGGGAVGMATPVIEGQNPRYVVGQIALFKSGARQDQTMHAMNSVAASLDDQTVQNVATFLASKSYCDLPGSIVNPGIGDVNAGKSVVSAHSCTSCHLPNSPLNAPILVGQKTNYIVNQLNDFRNGSRKSQFMNSIANQLSDRDINDVAAFFNSQRNCPNQ